MDQNVEPQLIRGNVAIHTNEDSPDLYGDGSLEVQGKLYIDTVIGYTTNAPTSIHQVLFQNGTMSFPTPSTMPQVTQASSGTNIVYYDNATHQIRSLDDQGNITQVSGYRLNNKGDLLTNTGTRDIALPASQTSGAFLVSDLSTSTGLKWYLPPTSAMSWSAKDISRSSTNANVYISKVTLMQTIAAGTYRLDVTYNWSVTGPDQLFKARVLLDNTITVFDQQVYSSGTADYQGNIPDESMSSFTLLNLSEGSHTFELQWCIQALQNITASISNCILELTTVA